MKSVFKLLGIFLIILLIALVAAPFLFKGKILNIARDQANQNLNATVNFEDISLSFFRDFPNLNAKILELSIVGVDSFLNDTLVYLPAFEVEIDLASLFGEQIKLKSMHLEQPFVNIKVLKSGTANYDIVPASEAEDTVPEPDTESESSFSMALKSISTNGAHIVYDDAYYAVFTELQDFSAQISGDMTADETNLLIDASMGAYNFDYENIRYINRAEVLFDAEIKANLADWIFTFSDNELTMNEIKVFFEGMVDISDDVMVGMDLKLKSADTQFKSLLSMIPAIYAKDFEGLQASGTFDLNGYAKGNFNMDNYDLPEFELNMQVENGKISYPDLPKSIDRIQSKVQIASKGGIWDYITVDVHNFHVEMAGNPFDMSMHLATPESDMSIRAKFDGMLDFGSLKEIIPLDSMTIAGKMYSGITIAGKMSQIENEQFEQFTADGKLELQDFEYHIADVPTVKIPKAIMEFSPRYVELAHFEMLVGRSDFKLRGRVENFIPYIFSDGTVRGSLKLQSQTIDVNQFIGDESAEESTETEITDSTALQPFVLPKRMDFTFDALIGNIIYDQLSIKNSKGQISFREQKLNLNNLYMELLGGSMKLNGSYFAPDTLSATTVFQMNISNFNIPATFTAFNTVRQLAPIAQYANGNVSAALGIGMNFDQHLNPVYNSINSNGTLQTQDISIENAPLFTKLADVSKQEKYKNPKLKNATVNFEIVDGNLEVEPFKTNLAGTDAQIGGSQQLGGEIDYFIKTSIKSDKAADILSGFVPGSAGVIDIKIGIGGTVKDPKISGIESSAGDAVKDEVTDKLSDAALKYIEKVDAEAQKLIDEAERQAKNLEQEAANAALKMENEAKSAGKKLENEAGNNPIKKAAAKKAAEKLLAEAQDKGNKLKAEAKTKGDNLIKTARQKAEKMKKEAREKAKNM